MSAMDVLTYAAVTDVCARLAGRMSDDTLGTVRGFYAAGEWDLGDSTLLLNLAYEGVGITDEERQLIRSFLGEPDSPDLDDVQVIDSVPPLRYRFSPTGPSGAPDPGRADAVLSADAARHGGRRLRRAWRAPLEGDGTAWVYVLQVAEGTDELSAHSALTSRLWVVLQDKSPLEVVVEGRQLPPYQAAAVTVAHQIWPL